MKEVDILYKQILKESEKKESNIHFEEKINQIERKYEVIAMENQKLKDIVHDKTQDIEDLKKVLIVFHKDLQELKDNRITMINKINKKPNQTLDNNNKNFNTFKKQNLSNNLNKIKIISKEILLKKDDSNISNSAKNSCPYINLKNSSTNSTTKTLNKNNHFDEFLGNL